MGVMLGVDILDKAGSLVVGRLDGALVARLVVALVLCGAVGLERSRHDRASGLRTHILVGLGACLITMAGGYGFADIPHASTNPTNLAAYVVSGIGFLGAGAILRHGTTVRGMTTAASLWGTAGIGIAVGMGLAGLAAVTVALVLFTLVPLQRWEAHLREREETRDLVIVLRDDSQAVGKALATLARLGVQVRRAIVVPGWGTARCCGSSWPARCPPPRRQSWRSACSPCGTWSGWRPIASPWTWTRPRPTSRTRATWTC